jgi:putative heme-binding domain-containing protein
MSQNYGFKYIFSLAAIASLGFALNANAQSLPSGKGKAEFQRVCSACHSVNMATTQHMSRSEWQATVDDMVSRGAQGSQEDLDNIVTYLATNFGNNSHPTAASAPASAPAPAQPSVSAAAAAPAPVAPLSTAEIAKAKELLNKNSCLSCHRVENEGAYQAPDLTDIGAHRTPEQIRASLVSPNADLLPQNRLVHLVTNDGKTVDGKILNQDGFSVLLIDASSNLVTYQKANLREFKIIEKNPMPSYENKMSAQDLTDLVHYLSSLR